MPLRRPHYDLGLFRVACVAACLAVTASLASAQRPVLHIDRYTAQQGLAQDWVVGVARDSAGFAWVGTKRGLQRFDGRSFLAYSFLNPAGHSELAGEITGVLIGRDDALWVATPVSIFRIAPDRRRLARYPLASRFEAWSEDGAGTVWYLDGNVLRKLPA